MDIAFHLVEVKHFREMTDMHPPRRLLFIIASLCLLGALTGCGQASRPIVYTETCPLVERGQYVPESEHSAPAFAIGLDPHQSSYFMLPKFQTREGMDDEVLKDVEQQLYWLNFRFSHGNLLESRPNAEWFVAVPDSASVTESLGGEWDFFQGYLRHFCGWKKSDIDARVFPFLTSRPLIWTQDIGELTVRSGVPGAEIAYGPKDQALYLAVVRGLHDTYPDSYRSRALPEALSAEGGDLEIVWGPNRKPALLLGRHRVLRYLENTRPNWDPRKPVPQPLIEEARKAYSEAFGGLPVIIVTERALREPEKASEEVFHLDMLASIMDNHRGDRPDAFVPVFASPTVVDAISRRPLPSPFVRKVSWEFDEAARQLASIGYHVIRFPFNDHPARSPVNFGKCRDPKTGRYVMYLAKYPYHLPQSDPRVPQAVLMAALTEVQALGDRWNATGDSQDLARLRDSFTALWGVMDQADAAPNPLFDRRAQLARAAGYDVVEVHCYAWGSGGIHCQTLH